MDIHQLRRYWPEDALDRLCAQVQQLAEVQSRSIALPLGDTVSPVLTASPAARAGKFLGFDASGAPAALSGTGNDTAFRTDVATSIGATLVGWVQAGVSALARTVSARLQDVIHLSDFPTLAAADAAAVVAGKPILVPGGNYAALTVNSTVVVASHVILQGGQFVGTGSINFAGGVTGHPYYAFDVLVVSLGRTREILPEWFGARQATTVATGINAKGWNAWPFFITGANFLGQPGHDFGNTAYLAANKPFVAGADTWDMIGLQRAVWAAGVDTGPEISLAPAVYYVNRPIKWSCGAFVGMKGCGCRSSFITSADWVTHQTYGTGLSGSTKSLISIYRGGPAPMTLRDFALDGQNGYVPLAQGGTFAIALINSQNVNGLVILDLWLTSAEAGIYADFTSSDLRVDHTMFEFLVSGYYGVTACAAKFVGCSWWQSWVFASKAVNAAASTIHVSGGQVIGMDEPFNVGRNSRIDCDIISATGTGDIETNVTANQMARKLVKSGAGAQLAGRVAVNTYSAFELTVVAGGFSQGSGAVGLKAVYQVHRDLAGIAVATISSVKWGVAPAQAETSFNIVAVGNTQLDIQVVSTAAGGFQGWSTVRVDGGGYTLLVTP